MTSSREGNLGEVPTTTTDAFLEDGEAEIEIETETETETQ